MKFYLFTLEGSNKIIQTKWGQTCLIVAVLYIYHLIWTMCGVNMFSSQTRLNGCGGVKDGEEASEIFDTAIALVTIFHMIDWIRWTFLATTALVGVNLLPAFFGLTIINLPFGIISMIYAIITRYSTVGTACTAADK